MNFCKDCRWIEPQPLHPSRPYCTHPNSVLPGEISLVTGHRSPDQPLSCEMARQSWGMGDFCGPDGKYWEPRPPLEPVGFVDDDPPPRAGGASARP